MFSSFSVKKPMTIFVAVILVIILGVVSFTGMSTDLLPKIDLPYVIVATSYVGAAPEKVETAVTKPLEQTLATASGLENINSVSSENYSMIILEFTQNTNMDSAMIELSSKLDTVKANFEEGIGTPTLMKINPEMIPVMIASVDVDNQDIQETSKLVQDEIIPRIERVAGVASVSTTGLLEESVRVTLDNSKIDEINEKVLASVDQGLAQGKKQIDEGKKKLKEGKKLLEKESATQIEALVDSSMALEDGKSQLQEAIKNLPQLKEQLEGQREAVKVARDALAWLLEVQQQSGIEPTDTQKQLMNQLDSTLGEIDKGLSAIDTQQPTLMEQLEGIVEAQKQLEVGKLLLNQELTKASVTIATQEEKLSEAEKEFEASRQEAYDKANITGVITQDTISKLLVAQNFSMPAGYLTDKGESYIVKVGDKLSSLEELEDLVLFNIDVEGVGKIRLQDVAQVELVDNAEDMYAKINGNDGIILTIQKQSTASTAEVSDLINEAMEEMMAENSSLHITSLSDQGIYIDLVINSVLENLIYGGILAVIILLIFLKSIKPTIIIAFSIPISVLFAIVMMYFSGVTLNIISLSGLALGVGMLVDNSIVVIENIFRLRNQGTDPVKAAVSGATQVAGAIAASTLTTVCVFLPIVFTKGLSRQLFTDMGLTIAYSLIASLIVALTLVPAMASSMLSSEKHKEYKFFDKFLDLYESLLRGALKHKWAVIIGTLALLAFSAYAVIARGFILIPSMDSNQISVTLESPQGSTDEETRALSNEIIDRITAIEDVETVGALQGSSGIGLSMLGGGSDRNVSFYVILKEDKKLKSDEVGKLIEEATADLEGEIEVNTQTMDMSALGGSGVSLTIKGNDMDKLREISNEVMDIVKGVEGTLEVSNGLEDSTYETRITVDKDKASDYNLTIAQVYMEVASAIKEETTATSLSVGEEQYSVILVKDPSESISKEDLENYKITVTDNGEEKTVALKEIADITDEISATSISHENQSRFISVTADVQDGYNVSLVSSEVEKRLEDYSLPSGYSIEMGGELDSIRSAFTDLIKMIALAIVFIYLIMVAQFQSLLSPFIVMFTIPLAFTGGFLGLLLTGFELSMISMLGFLILSGIIVNNGIVFVDYVNQMKQEGMEQKEALVESGRTRMRPILMTALTTILGLSTLSLGLGMGADMVQPMAIVTIGGLIYATILTLFLVPVMYDIFHKKTGDKRQVTVT